MLESMCALTARYRKIATFWECTITGSPDAFHTIIACVEYPWCAVVARLWISHQPSVVLGASLSTSTLHVMVLIGANCGNIAMIAGGGASASAISGTMPSRALGSL